MAELYEPPTIIPGAITVGGNPTLAGDVDLGTGPDRAVAVLVMANGNGSPGPTIDSATAGGEAVDALGPMVAQSITFARGFLLLDPPEGVHSIQVTFTGGSAARSAIIAVVPLVDVSAFSGYNVAQGFGPLASVVIQSAVGDLVLGMAVSHTGQVTWTAGDGQDEDAEAHTGAGGDSNITVSHAPGAESVTMEHTPDASVTWVTMGISLASAGGGDPPAALLPRPLGRGNLIGAGPLTGAGPLLN